MENPEYMKVALEYFPRDIVDHYNVTSLCHSDGYIYIKIKKGMDRLKQAGLLAYIQLSHHLKKFFLRWKSNSKIILSAR